MTPENNITIKDIQSVRFTWDRMANVLTSMIIVGLLGLCAVLIYNEPGLESLLTLAIIVVVLGGVFSFTPRGLYVDNDYIIIHRFIGKVVIDKSVITSVKGIDASMLRHSTRLAGTMQVFGYWGIFRNRKLGKYRLYATNLNRLALIETATKKYVINY